MGSVWLWPMGTTLLHSQCSLLSLCLQLLPGTPSRESEFHFWLNWDRFYVGTQCLSVWLLNPLRAPHVGIYGELHCKRPCWGLLLTNHPPFGEQALLVISAVWAVGCWKFCGIQVVWISACPAMLWVSSDHLLSQNEGIKKKNPDKAWTELSVVRPGLRVLKDLG